MGIRDKQDIAQLQRDVISLQHVNRTLIERIEMLENARSAHHEDIEKLETDVGSVVTTLEKHALRLTTLEAALTTTEKKIGARGSENVATRRKP